MNAAAALVFVGMALLLDRWLLRAWWRYQDAQAAKRSTPASSPGRMPPPQVLQVAPADWHRLMAAKRYKHVVASKAAYRRRRASFAR